MCRLPSDLHILVGCWVFVVIIPSLKIVTDSSVNLFRYCLPWFSERVPEGDRQWQCRSTYSTDRRPSSYSMIWRGKGRISKVVIPVLMFLPLFSALTSQSSLSFLSLFFLIFETYTLEVSDTRKFAKRHFKEKGIAGIVWLWSLSCP